MQTVAYTDEQEQAIELACKALDSKQKLFRIGGYAGTGKTTILRAIAEQYPDLGIAAYTGKAVSVLRAKGIDASTIHRWIYQWDETKQRFFRKQEIFCSGFGVDEGSMVGGEIFHDLEAYQVPIVVVGDPGQLEPVSTQDINLMSKPDFILEQIHRQAQDNPIVELATRIRKNQPWGYQNNDQRCLVLPKHKAWSDLEWADIVICGFNRTRVKVNSLLRKKAGFKEELEDGDRLICLQNDYKLGVFNGLGLQVLRLRTRTDDYYLADLRSDDGVIYPSMPIWPGALGQEKTPEWQITASHAGKAIIADYGNCITCHKSQGSEYDRVTIIDEQCGAWTPARWRYTALTRAAKEARLYQ